MYEFQVSYDRTASVGPNIPQIITTNPGRKCIKQLPAGGERTKVGGFGKRHDTWKKRMILGEFFIFIAFT